MHHAVMVELHPSDVRLLYFEDCPNWRVAEADAPAGLTCRIYRTAMGVQPAPTVEQLQAALTR